jgi:hypothetical protein
MQSTTEATTNRSDLRFVVSIAPRNRSEHEVSQWDDNAENGFVDELTC